MPGPAMSKPAIARETVAAFAPTGVLRAAINSATRSWRTPIAPPGPPAACRSIIDPARGAGIAIMAPYLLIDGCHLVHASAPLQHNADVSTAPARAQSSTPAAPTACT